MVIADLRPHLVRLRELLPHRERRRQGPSGRSVRRVAAKRLLIKKRGRNLRAGQATQWMEEWLQEPGLYRLRGTIRYPKAA
jgi:hypothetical protein